MKKTYRIFASLLIVPFLTSCSIKEILNKLNIHININKVEVEDKPSDQTPTNPEIEYAEWPKKDVDDLTLIINDKTKDFVPSYNKAERIEIDSSTIIEDGFFGVYCYTSDSNSEGEYKQILEDAGWDVKLEKSGTFTEAFSPNTDLLINFEYNEEYGDLEIYVTEAPLLTWPTKKVAEAVKEMDPTATDVIPSYEAKLYTCIYYEQYNRVAINGYGNGIDITNSYKTKIIELGWIVKSGNQSDDFIGVSPNEQLEINFYYEEDLDNFNVDVSVYVPPVGNWPSDEISAVLALMNVTGQVEPFTFENSGFAVDDDYFPPAIMVSVESEEVAKQLSTQYNNMLLEKGYVRYLDVYGEPTFYYPGTTLCYRACQVLGPVVSIELFSYDKVTTIGTAVE